MAWTDIPDTTIAQNKPIKAETGLALRDNVAAAMNGDSGAPALQEAAMGSWYYTEGGIGTYCFARASTSAKGFGDTVSGSSLNPTGALMGVNFIDGAIYSGQFDKGSALSGTWQCMGSYSYLDDWGDGSLQFNALDATLWQRIA